jgi:hypothetical protein
LEVAQDLRSPRCKRHRVLPRAVAKALLPTRALCWTAVVKKEVPLTSSQRSKPVWFQYGQRMPDRC